MAPGRNPKHSHHPWARSFPIPWLAWQRALGAVRRWWQAPPPVDDWATAALMERFYGAGDRESFYWAGFVSTGGSR